MARLWAFSLTVLKHSRRQMSIKWRKRSIWDKLHSFPLSIQKRKLMNSCPISWMEHTFQLQKFPISKGDYHIPNNFPAKTPKTCVPFTSKLEFSGILWQMNIALFLIIIRWRNAEVSPLDGNFSVELLHNTVIILGHLTKRNSIFWGISFSYH